MSDENINQLFEFRIRFLPVDEVQEVAFPDNNE